MPDEYEDEEQDSSEDEDPVEATVEGEAIPRAQYDKVVKEARRLRTTLRRTELVAEFGAEAVDLVPTSIPLKEQRELAEKLAAKLSAASTQNAEGTVPPAEPVVEQPTEQERRAAALAREGAASTSGSRTYTPEEIRRIGERNEAEALKLIAAGLMQTGRR